MLIKNILYGQEEEYTKWMCDQKNIEKRLGDIINTGTSRTVYTDLNNPNTVIKEEETQISIFKYGYLFNLNEYRIYKKISDNHIYSTNKNYTLEYAIKNSIVEVYDICVILMKILNPIHIISKDCKYLIVDKLKPIIKENIDEKHKKQIEDILLFIDKYNVDISDLHNDNFGIDIKNNIRILDYGSGLNSLGYPF